MDTQDKTWHPVTEKLQVLFGPGYKPKDAERIRAKLLPLLIKELPQFDKAQLGRALDLGLRNLKTGTDWSRFICALLSHLPGWWDQLANNPGFGASNMLLLTDGSVMCQEQGGLRWKKLTPDANGSYVNGSWSDLAPMHWTRRYYASAVLNDGRVFIAGGEYSNAGSETNKAELYDPVIDTWIEIASPPNWAEVGDAACVVLPDGRVMLGNLRDTRTTIYDPVANTWTNGPTKGASSSEESWVLLPDNTVISVRCDSSRKADKYVAASDTWVDGGTLPTGIVETSSSEIGAGILLENGCAFFAGANNHTALYTPPAIASAAGTWAMGPDFPDDDAGQRVGCKDSPACLMTNGKVLIAAGPVDGVSNSFLKPTYFFEYDGSALNRAPAPGNASGEPYIGRMLLLPTGQILYAAQTDAIYVYNYLGCISAAARPHITACPATVRPSHSYTLHGRLLNGLSQAVGYGDDAAAATNYPLVRIRHLASGKVSYCRTFDHSTMGVGTGAAVHSTNFFMPCGIPTGASEICVVANGIASPGEPVNVQACTVRWPIYDERIYAMLIGSLADGPLWAWGPHGPVPVDPMKTKAAVQVKAARKSIVKGLDALHDLGQKLHVARGKVAGAQPLAADDDVGDAGGGGKQTRVRGGKAGRKGANAAGQTKAGRKRAR